MISRLTNRGDRKNPIGLSTAEAQQKANDLYAKKDLARFKTIIENGIDSREAYNEYLKRHTSRNTAPTPKADDAETQELPKVEEKGGKLAPEIDLHDLNKDGLRFTELLAKRNADGFVTRLERGEMERLREKLNGAYKPLAEKTPEELAELSAKAKSYGITRDQLIKRLGKFEETQAKLKEKGLPTHEDRLPLTGDKLYDMFAADSPNAKVYVGEGGLTPKMHKLLVELTKNKGTDTSLFRKVGGKLELTPHATSNRRGRKIQKMVNEINSETPGARTLGIQGR
jgi:hypothetical protein